MNHWSFIAAAYALTLAGLVSVIGASWFKMRGAEARASAVLHER